MMAMAGARGLPTAILAVLLGRAAAAPCNRSDDSSYFCALDQDGDPETNLCEDADVFAPPGLNAYGKVDVNISLAWMDLESIDERSASVTMRGDIQMWWKDCRWSHMLVMMHTDSEGCPKKKKIRSAISHLQGLTKAFNAMGNEIRDGFAKITQKPLLTNLPVDPEKITPESICYAAHAVDIWNPVPPQLQLSTADTTQSRSDSDVYFTAMQDVDPGLFSALIQDDTKLTFKVDMSYLHFPFDTQEVRIKLKFASDVHLQIIQMIPLGTEWKSYKEVVNARTKETYEESKLSVHVTQHVIDRFTEKGFHVRNVKVGVQNVGTTEELETAIEIDRRWVIVFARFFFPLIMLTFIPFAGFFMPVNMVMPRVATGFISFLTLTVFRNMAYAMIPKASSYLVWIDVVMITLTEVVWLAVVQNVVAQVVNKRVSLYAACAVDSLAQVVFIGLWAFELVLLFTTGFARMKPEVIMWLAQSAVVIVCGYTALRVIYIVRNIDRMLLRALAQQLMHVDILWHEPLTLENREKVAVFRWIDTNLGGKTGDVTSENCIAALKAHGMVFDGGEETERHAEFLGLMGEALGEKADPFPLHEFCESFDGLVGAGIAKARAEKRRQRTRRAPIASTPSVGDAHGATPA